jgi:hypothetical protein
MIGDEGIKFFKGSPVSAPRARPFQLVAVEWRFRFHWSRCPRCFYPVRVKVKLVGLGACSVLGSFSLIVVKSSSVISKRRMQQAQLTGC